MRGVCAVTEAEPLYGVMGNPVAHSLSPVIHRAFAEQTGMRLRYEAVLVEMGRFQEALEEFRGRGGSGCNVTVPFKEDAWRAATERTPRAELAGAANTLSLAPGRVRADNTDGAGLVRDLADNHGARLSGRRILVLGAGGAASGILGPLLERSPAELVVVNRTAERAVALARRFAAFGAVRGGGVETAAGGAYDLVINATSAGLRGDAPALPAGALAPGGWCYDLAYGPAARPFLAWARAQGAARALDGAGMLVEQAAESFLVWHGVRPRTAPVIAMLRSGV